MLGLESGLAETLSSASWLKPFFLFVVPLQVAFGILAFTLANRSGTRDVRVDSSGIEAKTLSGRLIRIGFGEIGEAYEDTVPYHGHRIARTVVKSRDGVRKVTFNIHNPRFGELLAALRAAGVDLVDRDALKRDPAAYRKRRERRQRRARLERLHGPLKVPGSSSGSGMGTGSRIAGAALVLALATSALPASSGDAAPAAAPSQELTGGVTAWGANNKGQLADGSVADRRFPAAATWRPGGPIMVPAGEDEICAPPGSDPTGERGLLYGKVRLAAGRSHTLSLHASGEVWAWGLGSSGQLGDGSRCDRDTQVRAVLPGKATAIAAGNAHSLALLEDGTVWSWGSNGWGELGTGFIDDLPSASPEGLCATGLCLDTVGLDTVSTPEESRRELARVPAPLPKQVPGLSNITAIAAGASHSLALTEDGFIYAWGQNRYGQLGIGYVVELDKDGDPAGHHWRHFTPELVRLPVRGGAVSIAAGEAHSLAVGKSGELWAWGSDYDNQLGGEEDLDPACWCRFSPRAVAGLPFVVGATAGAKHTVAWPSIGPVLAWGDNSQGQLGDGTTWSRHFPPAKVIGLDMGGFGSTKEIVASGAGGMHTLALNFDGSVTSWGANDKGQLGRSVPDGSAFDATPRLVPGLSGAHGLAAGGAHSLALGGVLDMTLIFPVETLPFVVTMPTPAPLPVASLPLPPRLAAVAIATAVPTATPVPVTIAPVRREEPAPTVAPVTFVQPPAPAQPSPTAVPPSPTTAPPPPTAVPPTATAVPPAPTSAPPTATLGSFTFVPQPTATPSRPVIR